MTANEDPSNGGDGDTKPTTGRLKPNPLVAAHEAHAHSDDDDRIALYMRRLPFTLAWWLALLCHCACAAFLFSTTTMYVFLGGINMVYYNKLLGSTLRKSMETWGYIFVPMAVVHVLEIARMLWFSIRAGKLTFNLIAPPKRAVVPAIPVSAQGEKNWPPAAAVKANRRRKHHLSVPPLLGRVLPTGMTRRLCKILNCIHPPPRITQISRRLLRFLLRIKHKLFDRKHGFLGLESPYFNLLFLLRESIEIASQSYQMYQCSMFISSAWINILFLAMTVANCWSTPILQHALARFNALERVICLALDGFLDAGTCMVIPLVIVFKYLRAFDSNLLEFPLTKLTDPEWFTALILENRMLFAMDKTDMFTSLMPHYSLFGCMRKVKRLIHRLSADLENEQFEVTYVNSMRVLVPKSQANAAKSGTDHRHESLRSIRQKEGKMPGWKRRFVHVFFAGWGATILAVHLRARQVALRYSDITACRQQLRPWFATSFMCATYYFDCVEQGNVETLNVTALSIMDATALSSLIISNCPALEMPQEIQQFSNLLKFMIYNSTVVSWTANASLNAVSHPELISIVVVATNMSGFPEGLLAEQPDSLQDVQFSKTNLAELPASVAKSWHVSKIFLEYSEFAEFPTVLLSMRVDELSLAGNKLTKLPDGLASISWPYEALVLGDNPDLTTFPSGGLPSGLRTLSVENTGINSLPSSTSSGTGSAGSATASPATRTTSSSSPGTSPSTGSTTGTAPSGSTGGTSGSSTGNSTTGGAMGGMGGGMNVVTTIYANNTPMCDILGGFTDADAAALGSSAESSSTNTTVDTSGYTVYCTKRDPSGVGRFPLDWVIERFRP